MSFRTEHLAEGVTVYLGDCREIEEMTLSQAVERFGGNYDSVKWRIYQGQTAEQALKLEPTR